MAACSRVPAPCARAHRRVALRDRCGFTCAVLPLIIPGSDPTGKVPMEKTIWTWFAVTAAICGSLVVLCWSIAAYLFVSTPTVHEIILSTDHGAPQVKDKASALFFPAAYQTLIFVMTLFPLIQFKKMIQKIAERYAPRDIWDTSAGGPLHNYGQGMVRRHVLDQPHQSLLGQPIY